ncbi:MAG: Gfo/Idh/MocA family oxidoreductase, partial [Pseudonocardia sp.]|nr:Gfo/Idh/MocA family oxidoreductase [Pseudonocardia sp.]
LLDRELDAVIVSTPDDTHVEIVVDFLEAGVAVFAEKPLATSTEGCDHILDVARRSGTRLYVGHNMRHMPVVATMRDLIEQGAVGEVKAVWCRHFVGDGGDFYFRDWHADRSRTTGLLVQKGAHDIDVIHWLSGSVTRRVTAMGGLTVYGDITDRVLRPGQQMPDWYDPDNNWPPSTLRGLHPVIDVEDLSMMLMQLENGTFASYQQCHFTPDYWRNYTVIGTEGRLENFGDEVGATVQVWSRRSGFRAAGDRTVEIDAGAGTHGGADVAIMAEFLRFVRHGGPTATNPIAAREAVAAGCAATSSLRTGGSPQDVPGVSDAVAAWFAADQAATAGLDGQPRERQG